ncbi:MAG: hypothetical protein DRP22_04450 [Verrucomicrobia bacterium]|nr:MAG: hypothetical protein DRP22_04450 [Verrucomicrobiota bacterium]
MRPGTGQRERRRSARKIRYVRPTVRAIRLNTGELLAVGCKLADGGNAWGGFTCTMNACVAAGS